jgi:hypothetical protein
METMERTTEKDDMTMNLRFELNGKNLPTHEEMGKIIEDFLATKFHGSANVQVISAATIRI